MATAMKKYTKAVSGPARRLHMGRLDNMKPAASAPHSRVLVCSTTLRDFSRWAPGRQFDVGSAKGRMDGHGVVRLAPAV
jgi:hypothetical protein